MAGGPPRRHPRATCRRSRRPGRPRRSAPSTDVYGSGGGGGGGGGRRQRWLGAILYELLAGRPPFLEPTVIATLQQVVHADPRPPRAVTPGVPRDLDTICRKCLDEVAPGKRYPTADAVAADLRAYLAGRTITAPARRAPWERGYRLARRHPAWAAVGLVGFQAATVTLIARSWRCRTPASDRRVREKDEEATPTPGRAASRPRGWQRRAAEAARHSTRNGSRPGRRSTGGFSGARPGTWSRGSPT